MAAKKFQGHARNYSSVLFLAVAENALTHYFSGKILNSPPLRILARNSFPSSIAMPINGSESMAGVSGTRTNLFVNSVRVTIPNAAPQGAEFRCLRHQRPYPPLKLNDLLLRFVDLRNQQFLSFTRCFHLRELKAVIHQCVTIEMQYPNVQDATLGKRLQGSAIRQQHMFGHDIKPRTQQPLLRNLIPIVSLE